MGEEDSSFISFEKLLVDLDATNEYFLNVFKNKSLDVGILRLRKGRQIPKSRIQLTKYIS
jgi:hypothetical protein